MFKDIVWANRSYRSFDMSKRIGEDKLREYVDMARITASTANLQALKYRIVHTEKECEKALSCTKWAGYLKDMQIPPAGHAPTGYVVICCDNEITSNTTAFYKDTGIAAQTILLAAAEDGFGGCMIGSVDEAKIKNELSIPENMTVTLVVALGAPDEKVEIVDFEGDIKYYRENGVHYVPKRSLDEVLI